MTAPIYITKFWWSRPSLSSLMFTPWLTPGFMQTRQNGWVCLWRTCTWLDTFFSRSWQSGVMMNLTPLKWRSLQLASWLQDRSYCPLVIINEKISLFGQIISRRLMEEVREAGIFSVLADEASDIRHREQLSLCIRWVHNDFEIHKDFPELIEAPKTDTNTITLLLTDRLVHHCLSITRYQGLGYDGGRTFQRTRWKRAFELKPHTHTASYQRLPYRP